VKKDRNADLFICITESKRMQGEIEAAPTFEKHKVFLYKEDFSRFMEGLEDAIDYIKDQLGEIEDREDRKFEPAEPEEEPEQADSTEPTKRRGLFSYFK